MDITATTILTGWGTRAGYPGLPLARLLVRGGYDVVAMPVWGLSDPHQPPPTLLRASALTVGSPPDRPDILAVRGAGQLERHSRRLSPGGLICRDRKYEPGFNIQSCLVLPLDHLIGLSAPDDSSSPATRDQREFLEAWAVLGVLAGLLGLSADLTVSVLDDLPENDQILSGLVNPTRILAALSAGHAFSQRSGPTRFRLRPLRNRPRRKLLSASQAVMLGALDAGLTFCSYCPECLASTVALDVIDDAPAPGLSVVRTASADEAVSLAAAAAKDGARALAPVSACCFDPPRDAPLVVVMRFGPVHIPLTHQGPCSFDSLLRFSEYGFEGVVLTPGTVEEHYQLTRLAFALTRRVRRPVMLLTDAYMAASCRAVAPLGTGPAPGPSHGLGPAAGADPAVPDRLTEVAPLTFIGDPFPEILLVCWGSTFGPADEAVGQLQAQGRKAAILHFSQVWPLNPDDFLPYLRSARVVAAVEQYAAPHLAELLELVGGMRIGHDILCHDGGPLTVASILTGLDRIFEARRRTPEPPPISADNPNQPDTGG